MQKSQVFSSQQRRCAISASFVRIFAMHRPNRVTAMSVNGVCVYGGSKHLLRFIFSKGLTRANLTQYQQFLAYCFWYSLIGIITIYSLRKVFWT